MFVRFRAINSSDPTVVANFANSVWDSFVLNPQTTILDPVTGTAVKIMGYTFMQFNNLTTPGGFPFSDLSITLERT